MIFRSERVVSLFKEYRRYFNKNDMDFVRCQKICIAVAVSPGDEVYQTTIFSHSPINNNLSPEVLLFIYTMI